MKNLKTGILSILMVTIAILLFINGNKVVSGVSAGLSICVNAVIPSLFPFMILSTFIINSRLSDALSKPFAFFTTHILHLPVHTGSVFLLSLIGGYPIGARAIAQLYKEDRLSQQDASRMLCFCVNAGPAFLITAVGGRMFGNQKAGFVLFAAQTTASIIISIATGLNYKSHETHQPAEVLPIKPVAESFVSAVTGASQGLFTICAFVVGFSAILTLVNSFSLTNSLCTILPFISKTAVESAVTGFFEVTLGCSLAAKISGTAAIIFASAMCSVGGLSVICQTLSCFAGLKINTVPYFISRIAHAIISCITTYLLTLLFPDAVSVFSATGSIMIKSALSSTPIAACILILLCSALIVSSKEKIFL